MSVNFVLKESRESLETKSPMTNDRVNNVSTVIGDFVSSDSLLSFKTKFTDIDTGGLVVR